MSEAGIYRRELTTGRWPSPEMIKIWLEQHIEPASEGQAQVKQTLKISTCKPELNVFSLNEKYNVQGSDLAEKQIKSPLVVLYVVLVACAAVCVVGKRPVLKVGKPHSVQKEGKRVWIRVGYQNHLDYGNQGLKSWDFSTERGNRQKYFEMNKNICTNNSWAGLCVIRKHQS